jgi:hypothetical protein
MPPLRGIADREEGVGRMVQAQPTGAQNVAGEAPMAASSLIRWSGLAAILGGLLTMPGSFSPSNSWMGSLLSGVGYALLVVGIIGTYLYLRRSGRFGLLGTVGFYLCVFAFVVVSILNLGVLLNVWGARWLGPLSVVYEPPALLGLVMFGMAILRSGRLPRGGAWLLIAFVPADVGAIVAMVVSGYTLPGFVWLVPDILLGLGWVWIGYSLWSESGAADRQPSRVS